MRSLRHLEERRAGWYYDKQDNHLYVKLQSTDHAEADFIVKREFRISADDANT